MIIVRLESIFMTCCELRCMSDNCQDVQANRKVDNAVMWTVLCKLSFHLSVFSNKVIGF